MPNLTHDEKTHALSVRKELCVSNKSLLWHVSQAGFPLCCQWHCTLMSGEASTLEKTVGERQSHISLDPIVEMLATRVQTSHSIFPATSKGWHRRLGLNEVILPFAVLQERHHLLGPQRHIRTYIERQCPDNKDGNGSEIENPSRCRNKHSDRNEPRGKQAGSTVNKAVCRPGVTFKFCVLPT